MKKEEKKECDSNQDCLIYLLSGEKKSFKQEKTEI